jgi:hypothetical protein
MLAGAGQVAVTITEEIEQHERDVFIINLKRKIPHFTPFQTRLFTGNDYGTSSC